MTFADWEIAAQARHLTIFAAFHPDAADGDAPPGCETLLMLGPHEPGFWPMITAAPEWADDRPDPMDRWSRRVIGGWAAETGAVALYPFGGPPFRPFIRWALDSGWVHASPVGLLVRDSAGLWVSFRGALALRTRLELPAPPPTPCATCRDRPCEAACPVGALGPRGYDVPACKTHVESDMGQCCRNTGCQVRSACPAGRGHGRMAEHSAYHMAQFL